MYLSHIWILLFQFSNRRFWDFYNLLFFFLSSSKQSLKRYVPQSYMNHPNLFVTIFLNPTTRRTSKTSSRWSSPPPKKKISPPFINQSSLFFQWIFLWYVSKVCKKVILFQLLGEPWEHNIGEWSLTKKVPDTQNFIKDKMTGRVINYESAKS